MRVVWKWPLDQMDSVTTLTVPRGTRFVAAGIEPDSTLVIWGECDPVALVRKRDVYVVDTGQEIPAGTEHVATIRSVSGVFVWHIYAVPEGE